MHQSSKIKEYLNIVCEQIRWKKAHAVITKEIEDHINDQRNAFIADGLDEESATDKAIKEMGDPVLIGSEFDRTYRPKIEWSIIALTGVMLLIGFAIKMFFTYDSDAPWVLPKSFISTVIGAMCMLLVYYLDFTTIGKYPKAIYLGFIAITIGVSIISPLYNGKSYYTQFVLLLFPTVFAGIIYSLRTKGYLGVILCGALMAIPVYIGFTNSNFSGIYLFSLACLILLTLAIAKGWFNVRKLSAILLIYIPTIVVSAVTIISNPYRLNRLIHSIVPSLDPRGNGWIGTITRSIITNAKFIGRGDFEIQGFPVTMALPSIDTDFLLTYLIHEIGWISFIIIITVLLVFIIRSFILCSRQKSILGKLVSTSVLITFTMQVVVYVASNLGFQLISQQTLPLISYGGVATIINMILIGVMLSVFKSGDIVTDNIAASLLSKNKLFEISDGKIIINLNNK